MKSIHEAFRHSMDIREPRCEENKWHHMHMVKALTVKFNPGGKFHATESEVSISCFFAKKEDWGKCNVKKLNKRKTCFSKVRCP
ncbi:CLUMA_CG006735, isoform A [Clunio marinus]|uniref:CLUMA_CG006735, isoform A n=1 Tax=Clunio marinus TaxID=568069 RepID=A0A1J1HYL7_9DIPT|nr:CLUMA_CG006735, isoform A [Clunio marinus]